MTANTELPPLPDFAPVWQHIMTVDGTKRVAAYNALCDMLHAYARAALAQPQQAAPEPTIDGYPLHSGLPPPAVKVAPLRRGLTGRCVKKVCECERAGLGDECIWLDPIGAAPAGQAAAPSLPTDCHDRGACAFHDECLYKCSRSAPAAEAAQPAAWRYQDARGHFRYRAYKPGFDVEYAILKPVPLYAAPIAQAEAVQPAVTGIRDLRDAKWLDPQCADRGACQSLLFKATQAEAVQSAQAVRLTDAQVAAAFGWTSGHGPLESEVRYARIIERAVWAANNLEAPQ
jgi:hypothetical protein